MKDHGLVLLGLGALLAAAAGVPAQVSKNVQRLANYAPEGKSTNPRGWLYNDCWGYAAPDGREFAIFGSTKGTYIVETTNPSQPVQRAFIPASASGWRVSTWRDMKTYGKYLYVVTEGGGGFQIIDLGNPSRPKLIKTWGGTIWGNAHNIAMDTGAGVAYPCGTRTGMHLIDVKTDPINPKLIATFRTPYIHDLHVQHGFAHLADLYNNNYLIVDVRNLPSLTTIGRVRTPGTRYCHSMWATADDRYCLTNNEAAGGPVAVYDITNRKSPRLIAKYTAGPSTAIPHNVLIRDRVAHISYYTEGYRAVDISDPTRPVEVGYYDTWAGVSSGYSGDWGVYCFQPSGTVYASDLQSGLWIFKPKATATRYGTGTPGTGGVRPTIKHFGAAYLGNAHFKLAVENGKPRATTYLLLGFAAASLNVKGLNIHVQMGPVPAAIIPTATDASGKASVAIGVPNLPALNNLTLYTQFFVGDPMGALGLSASRGMKFELFTR